DGIFSTVVSSTGEAIYNFGWWGLALIIVVAAIVLRLLDGFLLSRLSAQRLNVMGLLGLVFAAMLAGAIADYTWSGVHTYAARMIARLPAFLLIVTAAWLTTRIRFNLQPRRQHATHAKFLKRNIQECIVLEGACRSCVLVCLCKAENIVCQFSIRFVSVKELFGHASAVASHHCSSLGIVHEISNGLGNIRTIFT